MSNKSEKDSLDLSAVLDASLTEGQKKILETNFAIKEDFKAFQKKEEETRGHLFVLGNLLLGVFTVGIVHAIFYIGCLIAYGTQVEKWESKDPITWFFHRINVNLVIKKPVDTEVGITVDDENAGEISLQGQSSLSASS